MALHFRNIDADPSDPVETWPYEGLVTAIERGTAIDWRRIAKAMQADPWGEVARSVEDYLSYADDDPTNDVFELFVTKSREEAEAREADDVAGAVRAAIRRSGLTRAQFASRLGTSASRLSTYATGKVMPSAALMLRMERVAQQAADPPTS